MSIAKTVASLRQQAKRAARRTAKSLGETTPDTAGLMPHSCQGCWFALNCIQAPKWGGTGQARCKFVLGYWAREPLTGWPPGFEPQR